MTDKKLYRLKEKSMIGGVCSGIADYLTVDPVLIRLLFGILTLLNGLGVMIYLVLWLVLPLKGKTYESQDIIKENLTEMTSQAQKFGSSMTHSSKGPVLIGVILIGLGLLFLLKEVFPWMSMAISWPLVAILVGAYLLLKK